MTAETLTDQDGATGGTVPGTAAEVAAAVHELIPGFRARADEADAERIMPRDSAEEMRAAGLARSLVPKVWGGSELTYDTWVDAVMEIAQVDASHAWCAQQMISNPTIVASFSREAQAAVWENGPDMIVAGSVPPLCQVTPVEGGYRVSGKSPFASGVANADWVFVSGFVADANGVPAHTLLLVPAGEYEIIDTWHVNAMRGTGSNTIVTEDVFVPAERTLAYGRIMSGETPGAEFLENPMYGLPFAAQTQCGYTATIIGAARGAAAYFRDWATTRTNSFGEKMAELPSVQVPLARIAADLDACEMLLRRVVDVTRRPEEITIELRARALRDCARVAEIGREAINTLIGVGGTAGYATTNPIQRAWRDINFAACHISLNAEKNHSYWGRVHLGVEDPTAGLAIY